MTLAYSKHLLRQRHAVASLGGSALRAWLAPTPADGAQPPAPPLPGPELIARIPPPAAALVRDYLLHVGGDPGVYRGSVPPHLFLQWSLPLAARTLHGLPYRLLRIVNAGCRIQVGAALDAGAPFTVRARLEGVADDGRRAALHQRIVTGTAQNPQALIADLYTVVPSADGGDRGRNERAAALRRAEQRVPEGAREIARWSLARGAGLAFAALTGDFNPVHWARPYARALGFSGTILHGFATLARAWEGLHRARFAGAVDRLRVVDARFLRPLVLPADVGLYLAGSQFFVAGAPGARPYLAGSFEESAA